MKEVLTRNFWRGVKKTFDEARDGPAPPAPAPDKVDTPKALPEDQKERAEEPAGGQEP